MLGGLSAAVGELRARSVPHALVGAAAMAGRGVMRATDDVDLLDASALLEAGDRRKLEAAVDAQIGRLPSHAREAWRGLAGGPGTSL